MSTVTPPTDQDSAASRASAAFPYFRHDVRAHKLFLDKTEGLKSRALIANVGKRFLRQASSPQCPILAPGLLQAFNGPCLLGYQVLRARFSLSGARRYLVSEGFLQGNSRA